MCEETKTYFWALQDILGHGATSQVFKAYHKTTGELVAAKVYQVSSTTASNLRSPYGVNTPREKDFRPILDREMDILKDANHENIVRYIALEPVISSDAPNSVGNREALMIEYCNGGSLHNVLELPENRYGLMEDDFMLLFKHLTSALKYLHGKNTIHRDIKPDNIMLSININGERTYKLADLGVARLINEGEDSFKSLVGTEEYIHPVLYRVAVSDSKTNMLRSALPTRVDFPFEVDLWSLGVTLYQCATGELPFQPYAGTRKDRNVMRQILDNKPFGFISGMEKTPGGEIQWSKTLPESCRLSSSLKQRLEILLQRLLESDRHKLMAFRDFFNETDRILNTIPIYYLNLKRFTLQCTHFEPTQSITTLYDQLHHQNDGDKNEEYYCLFQNIPYPVSKTKPMSIKTFCEQLPIPTSRENPLVFYTFSSLPPNDHYSPKLLIPEVKQIRQQNDVASACDWSKDVVGLFFYVKVQLLEYQHILQTAQCSTTIMQQHLKSKLLEFLCSLRSKLIVFRAIEELKNILDQIDSNASGTTTPTTSSSMNFNAGNGCGRTTNEAPALGFSHLLNNNPPSADNSLSPITPRRTSSASPMQLIQQSIRIFLRSYVNPYEQLKKCEQDILIMIEREFGGELGMIEDHKPFVNTLWLSHRTKTYSTWIHRAEIFLKDVSDLNETFRRDRLLSSYNRLQSDSHFRRRKNLVELQEKYIHFVNDECYPNLVQIFNDYNEWIQQRSAMIQNYERIQESYKKQCEEIVYYVDMIDELRQVVYKNIRELGGTSTHSSSSSFSSTTGYKNDHSQLPQAPTPPPPPPAAAFVYHQPQQHTGDEHSEISHQLHSSGEEEENCEHSNKTFIKKIRGTTRKTIQHAEESFMKMDGLIKQIRNNIQKK